MSAGSSNTAKVAKQPAFFIPHGAGPCFFMDWDPAETWDAMATFLKSIPARLPSPPKAILVISAHWQTSAFAVTSQAKPELLYDYYGFPEHTYQLTYPAIGDPVLADRVQDLLGSAGVTVGQDASRGFDHGVFIPLKLIFPDADIPVIQLSLQTSLDPRVHIKAGQALACLRDEGVLLLGSGMSFHNMRGYGDQRFTGPSEIFDQWLTDAVESDAQKRNALLEQWHLAPHAYDCHPKGQQEHLLPLMVVAGAAGLDWGRKVHSEKALKTQLSAFQFG